MKIEIVIETTNDDYLTANQVNDIKSYVENHISNLEFGKIGIHKMKELRSKFSDGVIVGSTYHPLSDVIINIKIGSHS
jgi:hypothetical protein